MGSTRPLNREDAPAESTWNREGVYESWDAWEADLEMAHKELPELINFSGRLKDGPATLVDWFDVHGKHWRRMMKLFLFTRMAIFVDGGDVEAKGHYGQVMGLQGKFNASIAFAKTEMQEIGETLLVWADEDPRLGKYTHYFDNLLRQKPHQRSAEVEEVLSMLEEPFSGVSSAANDLTNTDMKFAEAVDSQGNTHPVHQATIPPTGIQSSDRERRRTAWENFCDSHLAMQNTLAGIYISFVKQQVFLTKVRGFDSVLEARLFPSGLPVEVFHTLIDAYQKNLPVWHRYWDVKRKILKVETLHPYDIWAPILENPPVIPYKQSVDWICEALSPLGDEYVKVMRKGCLEERWVDYAPNIGKMQGGGSSPCIGMPPFIFISNDNTVMSMSALAHELGHAMHFHFTAENQPDVYNDFFESMNGAVMETASNFNQAMARAYLREARRDDRNFQIALIDEAFFIFHRYFFIMPTLARFENEVYTRAQQGKLLNAIVLNQIMREFFAEGYGDTMTDDPDRTSITWAQFAHLYFPFYTFQYAVGISAAHALANSVLSGNQRSAQNYINFLRAGNSMSTVDLLNLAGVDMTSPEPIEKTFDVLAAMVKQLEAMVT